MSYHRAFNPIKEQRLSISAVLR